MGGGGQETGSTTYRGKSRTGVVAAGFPPGVLRHFCGALQRSGISRHSSLSCNEESGVRRSRTRDRSLRAKGGAADLTDPVCVRRTLGHHEEARRADGALLAARVTAAEAAVLVAAATPAARRATHLETSGDSSRVRNSSGVWPSEKRINGSSPPSRWPPCPPCAASGPAGLFRLRPSRRACPRGRPDPPGCSGTPFV